MAVILGAEIVVGIGIMYIVAIASLTLENLSRLKAMWYIPSVKLTIHPPFSPLKA